MLSAESGLWHNTVHTHTETHYDLSEVRHTMTSVKSICFNNTKYTSVTYIQQRCHNFFFWKPGNLLQSQTKHPWHHHSRATPRVDSDPAAVFSPPTSGHEAFLVCFVDNGHVMLSMFHLLLIRLRAAHWSVCCSFPRSAVHLIKKPFRPSTVSIMQGALNVCPAESGSQENTP